MRWLSWVTKQDGSSGATSHPYDGLPHSLGSGPSHIAFPRCCLCSGLITDDIRPSKVRIRDRSQTCQETLHLHDFLPAVVSLRSLPRPPCIRKEEAGLNLLCLSTLNALSHEAWCCTVLLVLQTPSDMHYPCLLGISCNIKPALTASELRRSILADPCAEKFAIDAHRSVKRLDYHCIP